MTFAPEEIENKCAAPVVIQAPARIGVMREIVGLLELPRLIVRFPSLARQPRGHGEPVLVLPGYGCGNGSTVVLQGYLRFLGYRVRGCGRGIYRGDVRLLLLRVLRRLMSMAYRSHQPVAIVGWSLGGYLAREAARERPDLVRQIITLGTPVIGGPKYTVVAEAFRRRGVDIEALASEVELRNQIALTTPVTAIYSRADSVVAWRACIDTNRTNVDHIEVRTTHVGLGFSPEVYRIIARKLAGTASTLRVTDGAEVPVPVAPGPESTKAQDDLASRAREVV
ncbi:MAG TPA: alpha/beta fold hydrolase [Candidatus Eisenbacteria bacterium]|nr:alpha/beta fold hydrolase [Candidatus Eisenbacteria bacterium]